MTFGLSETEYDYLKKNLIERLKKCQAKVFIFGSRATNKHHKFSDIDVLFVQDPKNPIPSSLTSEILTEFEDSHFPYKIDLVDGSTLAKSYRANIEATRVEV
ncbi:nucleotidyltransferase domain-containing protein [bacterium]|nr:nucleotidyltransferase domain-containing protein [bacterium]